MNNPNWSARLFPPYLRAVVLAAALGGCGGGGSDSSSPPAGLAAIPASYAVGGSVGGLIGKGLVLQINGGGDLAIAAEGTFTFPGVLTEGSTYAVTVKTQPNLPRQNCTAASGGSGTVVGAPVTNVAIACGFPAPKFAYTANNTSNDASAYTVNPSTGALASVAGAPFPFPPVGIDARTLVADPLGKFVYVPSYAGGGISGFAINAGTGALTSLPGSPFTAFGSNRAIALDGSGKFAYVMAQSGLINVYSINAVTGALSTITGSPFSVGTNANGLVLEPSGRYAYVSDVINSQISALSIQAGTGALTPIAGSPFVANSVGALAADPLGRFLYASDLTNGTVSAYTINAATGALAIVAGSTIQSGSSPVSIAIEPLGNFIYVANLNSQTITAYVISAVTGRLTAVTGSPFVPAAGRPSGVTVDPSGKFLYATTVSGDSVTAYGISASTGALTLVIGSPFAVGAGPQQIIVSR